MRDDEYHPELDDEAGDDARPLRTARRTRVMRVLAIIALAALILPVGFGTLSTNARTATSACQIVVAQGAPAGTGSVARFELFGAEGPGWYCYAIIDGGRELLMRGLGLIPEISIVPGSPPGDSA